jgi:hypothetical protein
VMAASYAVEFPAAIFQQATHSFAGNVFHAAGVGSTNRSLARS